VSQEKVDDRDKSASLLVGAARVAQARSLGRSWSHTVKRFLQATFRAGVPFGVAMGVFFYVQHRQPMAILGGLVAGLLFGIGMALIQQRGEKRLRKLGLVVGDLRPVQERAIPLQLDVNAALEKSRSSLSAIRKMRPDSILVNSYKISAATGMTWQSFGEHILVDVQPTTNGSIVKVTSRPKVSTTTMDSGKGFENVEVFAKALQ
jgi:hypothetical protein